MNADEALPITPSVLKWARERAGYSLDDASRVFKKIAAWEAGAASPSYAQLEQMADRFKCPVAMFFFPKPPALPELEQSFRTLTSEDFASIPRTVRLFLRRAQAMQVNLAELNDGKNQSPRLVTRDLKFSPNMNLDKIASEVRAQSTELSPSPLVSTRRMRFDMTSRSGPRAIWDEALEGGAHQAQRIQDGLVPVADE